MMLFTIDDCFHAFFGFLVGVTISFAIALVIFDFYVQPPLPAQPEVIPYFEPVQENFIGLLL
jgi:hypothetical protein